MAIRNSSLDQFMKFAITGKNWCSKQLVLGNGFSCLGCYHRATCFRLNLKLNFKDLRVQYVIKLMGREPLGGTFSSVSFSNIILCQGTSASRKIGKCISCSSFKSNSSCEISPFSSESSSVIKRAPDTILLRHFYTTFYLVRGNTPVDEKSRVISTASLPTEHGLPTGRFAAGMLLVRFNTKLPFSGIMLESSLLP